MKKEIVVIDKKLGIKRVTTLNERWYIKTSPDAKNGATTNVYLPSSTWIASYYPKGVQFYKWLADKGWDEAEALKNAAGDKGSKVHYACSDLDLGKEISIEAKYINNSSGQDEELTREEVDCIISYRDFIEEFKPQLLANEITGFGEFYAGTIDKIFRVNGEIWILDLKTSKSVWEEMILQISSYKYLDVPYQKLGITDEEWANRKLVILQIGYKLNKKGYKVNDIEDKYNLFKMARKIWQNENPESKPKERDYPLVIKSDFRIKSLAK